MSRLRLAKIPVPSSNPPVGALEMFYNTTVSKLSSVDESGNVISYAPLASPSFTGNVIIGNKITSYNGVATTGEGIPHIVYASAPSISGATSYTLDTGITAPGMYRVSIALYQFGYSANTWTAALQMTTGGWNPYTYSLGPSVTSPGGGSGGITFNGCAYHGANPAGVSIKIYLTATITAQATVWTAMELLYSAGTY